MANYVEIALEEFDAFMDAQGFDRIEQKERKEMYRKGKFNAESGEYYYEYMMDSEHAPGCRIRVYSSISIHKAKGRRNGTDAIRIVLVDPNNNIFHSGFKRTHRVDGWRLNLLKKYEEVIHNPKEYKWLPSKPCSCGGTLSTKYGKNGFFMGCNRWMQHVKEVQ